MIKSLIVVCIAACAFHMGALAQNSYRFVFYNVENYFDTRIDSTREYNEFTPRGERYWSSKKYIAKRSNLYKVITAIGGWEPITFMGFAEIENEFVLRDLIMQTPLQKQPYQIIHFESNDRRGIDVGIIYDSTRFKLLYAAPIQLKNPDDPNFRTRDILYAKGLISTDTIHIFVNHWPSRYGGVLESKHLRYLASYTLKNEIDSLLSIQPDANILVMGDFNDNPTDESMLLLGGDNSMYNLAMLPVFSNVQGTLKYSGKWDIFDQILVSSPMLVSQGNIGLKDTTAFIFDEAFLLEDDEKFLGLKPYRTYAGYKYNGGFSDHLPVYVDIYVKEK